MLDPYGDTVAPHEAPAYEAPPAQRRSQRSGGGAFSRGSGVTSRDYNPQRVGNIGELRASLRSYNLAGLQAVLLMILTLCVVLWLLDAQGLSWQAIGTELRTTRQTAQNWYNKAKAAGNGHAVEVTN